MNCKTIEKGNSANYIHPLYYGYKTSLNDIPEYNCFRLLLIEQGSGTIRFNNFVISFTGPTLFCINETDFPVFQNGSDAKSKSIYFYPNILNPKFNYENIRNSDSNFSVVEQQDCYLLFPFIQRADNFKGQLFIESNTFTRVSKLFEFIARELEQKKDIYWPCRSRSYLLELLILTTKLFDSAQNSSENDLTYMPEKIASIIEYLQNNYKEKITLEQLATMFTTNRTSINEQFYKVTSLSIIDYLITLRVNLAAAMLRDTAIPISEIMSRVGFNDSSHFWRTFKKHTSFTPKEYREKYCWIKD